MGSDATTRGILAHLHTQLQIKRQHLEFQYGGTERVACLSLQQPSQTCEMHVVFGASHTQTVRLGIGTEACSRGNLQVRQRGKGWAEHSKKNAELKNKHKELLDCKLQIVYSS